MNAADSQQAPGGPAPAAAAPAAGDERAGAVSEFLNKALPRAQEAHAKVWFRGMWDASMPLQPTLIRQNRTAEEQIIRRDFLLHASHEIKPFPGEWWEQMMVMQHYGAPTRLLDWTENPLVGLFFATWASDPKRDETDGVVWCLKPQLLNRLQGSADGVPGDIPFFGFDEILQAYDPNRIAQMGEVAIRASRGPIAVFGPRQTPRMHAQQGTFTLFDANPKPLNEYHDGQHVWKYVIPEEAKSAIRDQLAAININEMNLFPELDRIGKHARRPKA